MYQTHCNNKRSKFGEICHIIYSSTPFYLTDGKDLATAKPIQVPRAVSSGGAAALAIVLLIVGVAIVGLGYYFTVIRKEKKLEEHRTGQLTMSDM